MNVAVMRRIYFLILSIMIMLPGSARAASLIVEIVGLANDNGNVHVALYDDPAGFPKSKGMTVETEVPISAGVAIARFDNLSPQRHAIAVYHDENDDNKFNQGLFGIPLEDYGFSNDATVLLSPPTFEDAAFDVPETGTKIRIHLNR